MSSIHLDSSHLSLPALAAGSTDQVAASRGLPVHGQPTDEQTQRGPDATVQLSPEATEAAAATDEGQGSANEGQGSANDSRSDTKQHQDGSDQVGQNASKSVNGQPLTEEQQQEVDKLKQRDQEVRRHEQAHKAAAGRLSSGGPTYSYQTGPDGKQYAVGGEVQIDTSPVEGDPQATILKMEAVRRAATAPASPSSQDRAVAAQAARTAQKARQELQKQTPQSSNETEGGKVADSSSAASPDDVKSTQQVQPSSESKQDVAERPTPSHDQFVTSSLGAHAGLDAFA